MPPASDVEVKHICAAYDTNDDFADDELRCTNPVFEDGCFCEYHSQVKLCKASGICHYVGGQNGRFEGDSWMTYMVPHSVHVFGCTERAEFCSDRCRNLWRDTNARRERKAAIRKIESGERSERYAIIKNYRSSGKTVVLDTKTNRIEL